MATQVLQLQFTGQSWSGPVAIDDALAAGENLLLARFGTTSGDDPLAILGTSNNEDFSDELEQYEFAFTFTFDNNSYTISGPNFVGNSRRDGGSLYLWTPVGDWDALIDALDGQLVTLTLDDGAATLDGEWAELVSNPTASGQWADIQTASPVTLDSEWADILSNPTASSAWANIVHFEPPTADGEWSEYATNPTVGGEWSALVSYEPPTGDSEWADIIVFRQDVLYMATPEMDMQRVAGDGYEVRIFWDGPPPVHRYLGSARVRVITRSDQNTSPAPDRPQSWDEVPVDVQEGDFLYFDHTMEISMPAGTTEIMAIIPIPAEFRDAANQPLSVWMLSRLERANRLRETYPDPRIADNTEE